MTGELVQHNGRDYQANSAATATGTIYKAASGAYVVSTGTNYWARGLDTDGEGYGELNSIIQQATVNILSDMNTRPTTPISGMVVDTAGAPTVSGSHAVLGRHGRSDRRRPLGDLQHLARRRARSPPRRSR